MVYNQTMPTQNVNLSEQQAAFIHYQIESGAYCNASEVVRAGLRALEHKTKEDELKLQNLRRLVQEGMDCFERGEYKTLTIDELDAFMDSIPWNMCLNTLMKPCAILNRL